MAANQSKKSPIASESQREAAATIKAALAQLKATVNAGREQGLHVSMLHSGVNGAPVCIDNVQVAVRLEL